MFGLKTLVPISAIAILMVAPAEATTTYYTGSSGETSFNVAVGGLALLNPALTFSSGDLSPGVGLLNASGTGIDFLGFDDFTFNDPLDLAVSSGALKAAFPGEVVTMAFPVAGIYAFGIHITNTSGFANWCIDLTKTGCNFNLPETAPAVQFFGFVSDTAFTAPLYIRGTSPNPTVVFTNFEAYGPASVPEPSTMLLIGLGLVILPLIRQKAARPV
jgi:hypothetical protein